MPLLSNLPGVGICIATEDKAQDLAERGQWSSILWTKEKKGRRAEIEEMKEFTKPNSPDNEPSWSR